jgi:cobyrinic acid a,c-diamide synthase
LKTAKCQALLLSSYASNQGKTTVTASLAYFYRRQGRRVRVFKVGPDYLDPKILEYASGNPVYQLDLWMVGEEECRRLLFEAAEAADIILVEGVMGLFDGNPSSADLARRFGLPVVGIINAGSMAQSLHAVAYGLANFDPSLHYVGTLANCVASERHAQMIADEAEQSRLSAGSHPAYLGALMRSQSMAIPSRHLGLADASELENLEELLSAGADMVAATRLPQAPEEISFSLLEDGSTPVVEPLLSGVRVAIARDAAFSFIYQANLDFLVAMGAELCFFSPLQDENLPDCDAVYLPGGYPELHLERLSSNLAMKDALRKHQYQGKAIYAECGGMLYLLDELTDAVGQSAAMAGMIKGRARLQKKLARLGYQQFVLETGVVRGHTFHYSRAEVEAEPVAHASHPRFTESKDGLVKGASVKDSTASGEAMYKLGALTASYVHLYFASTCTSNPNLAARFFLPA